MKDMKEKMFEAMYRRVKEVKDILGGEKEGDVNPHNIVDYVVLNSCKSSTFRYGYKREKYEILGFMPEGDLGVVYIARRDDDLGELKPMEFDFHVEDFNFGLPRTKFCMEVLRCIYGDMEDFSEDIWEDIRLYGISKSCANMLNRFEEEGIIDIIDKH